MGFSFERLTTSFERLHHAHEMHADRPALPPTALFLHAMAEVVSMFETLGSAFSFVKRDLDKKMALISRAALLDPPNYSDLSRALAHERVNGLVHGHGHAHGHGSHSVARTLLRLMWALRFADRLLCALGRAFDDDLPMAAHQRTLRFAVAAAYDDALAAQHSWAVRRSVKGACLLLPGKEAFMARVGLDEKDREPIMRRLQASMSPLVARMYAYYEKHGLLQLP